MRKLWLTYGGCIPSTHHTHPERDIEIQITLSHTWWRLKNSCVLFICLLPRFTFNWCTSLKAQHWKSPTEISPADTKRPKSLDFMYRGFRFPKQIASYGLKARCKMLRNMNRNITMNFPLTLTLGCALALNLCVYVNIWQAVVKKTMHTIFKTKQCQFIFIIMETKETAKRSEEEEKYLL